MREQNEKMKFIFFGSFHLFILAACAVKEVTDSSAKNQAVDETDTRGHSHHQEDNDQQIYEGFFGEDQVKDRSLSDWEGDW